MLAGNAPAIAPEPISLRKERRAGASMVTSPETEGSECNRAMCWSDDEHVAVEPVARWGELLPGCDGRSGQHQPAQRSSVSSTDVHRSSTAARGTITRSYPQRAYHRHTASCTRTDSANVWSRSASVR